MLRKTTIARSSTGMNGKRRQLSSSARQRSHRSESRPRKCCPFTYDSRSSSGIYKTASIVQTWAPRRQFFNRSRHQADGFVVWIIGTAQTKSYTCKGGINATAAPTAQGRFGIDGIGVLLFAVLCRLCWQSSKNMQSRLRTSLLSLLSNTTWHLLALLRLQALLSNLDSDIACMPCCSFNDIRIQSPRLPLVGKCANGTGQGCLSLTDSRRVRGK